MPGRRRGRQSPTRRCASCGGMVQKWTSEGVESPTDAYRAEAVLCARRHVRLCRRRLRAADAHRRRDAHRPELAAFGPSAIGVRTLTAVDRNRPDILRTKEGEPTARYDRRFVLEVWYPATLAPGQTPGGTYQTVARDPSIAVTLRGQAVRDAALASAGGPFPLVILSHGYPGNRYLMSHLGENLASKGFIVVVHRPRRQHLRRPAGLREHAVQPALRPAVRPRRDGAPRRDWLRQLPERTARRHAHRHRRLLDGRLRPASTRSAVATATRPRR